MVRTTGGFFRCGNNLKLSKLLYLNYEGRDSRDWFDGDTDCRKIT